MLKIYLLNIQTREWNTINTQGTIVDKLELYSFNRCDSGSFYVFGGVSYSEESNFIYSLDRIDEQFVWHRLECTGNKPSPRSSVASVSLGDSILFFGGKSSNQVYNDGYAFNPNLGLRWLCLKVYGEVPTERVGHVSCFIPGLEVILMHGGDCRGKVSNDLYIFKPKDMS